MPLRRLEYVRLDQLVPALQNPKGHDHDGIAASFDRFGYIEPIVEDDRTGRLLSGHGRLEQLQHLYEASAPVPDGIDADEDGMWLAPVVKGWASADDDEAKAAVIAVNHLVEQGGWVQETLADQLQALLATPQGLTGTGYTEPDLAALLASLSPPVEADPEPPVVEPPAAPVTQTGDTWLLGEHRVHCGDSLADGIAIVLDGSGADVLLTDPPYGIGLDIANDDLAGDALDQFNAAWVQRASAHLPASAAAVVFSSSRTFPSVLDGARDAGWRFLRYLTLYKPNDQTYPWRGWLLKSEAILLFSRGNPDWQDVHPFAHDTYLFNHGGYADDPVGGHPAVKPLPVLQDVLSRLDGNVVLDPFGGAGTTLIACENLHRSARLVEQDPGFVDVICARWQRHTGQLPVLEATGAAHDFAA